MFAAGIRRKRVSGMRASRWRCHLDETFVKVNGIQHHLWGAVDHDLRGSHSRTLQPMGTTFSFGSETAGLLASALSTLFAAFCLKGLLRTVGAPRTQRSSTLASAPWPTVRSSGAT